MGGKGGTLTTAERQKQTEVLDAHSSGHHWMTSLGVLNQRQKKESAFLLVFILESLETLNLSILPIRMISLVISWRQPQTLEVERQLSLVLILVGSARILLY